MLSKSIWPSTCFAISFILSAVLLTSEVGSILTLVGVGAVLIVANGRFQLVNQAKSELKVAEINYNLKIEQMELTFDSQANNLGIIEAAETQQATGQVLTTLANELHKQKLELVCTQIHRF